MSGKNFITMSMVLVSLFFANNAIAARGSDKEPEPPKVLTDLQRKMLQALSAKNSNDQVYPFTDSQREDVLQTLADKDRLLYGQMDSLKVINDTVNLSLRNHEVITVNLGHNYTSTLTFVDRNGNPWSVDMLTDISNSDVVSVNHPAKHILTFRPKKRAGQTNLPVILKGEQRSITILLNISTTEVNFTMDVKADGIGDSRASQQNLATQQYSAGKRVTAKLDLDPAKEMMLQALTPEGAARKTLKNEYGERVDPRDFMGWTYNGKLYILTPHRHYTPAPVGITPSSDGRYLLLEYKDVPVVMMKMNNLRIMLRVE